MAGSQEIRFDFLSSGAEKLAGDFRKTGDTAAAAARGAKVLQDVIKDLGTREDRTAAQSQTLAKALRLTGDAEDRAAAKAVLADAAFRRLDDSLKAQGRAAEDAAVKTRLAGDAAKGAGGGFGGLGAALGPAASGMGALVGAGVILSPVIATLGVGLGGLALAAYSATKNTDEMGRIVAPLKSEFTQFSASLQPEVLTAFGLGAKTAGHLLHDIQPVAAATGKALDSVLGRVDATFQSGTWQQFFGFMAQTAGPDLQLLGNLFIDLTNDLPQLLTQLQPLAQGLLILADDAAKAGGALALISPIASAQSAAMAGSAVAAKEAAGQQENLGEKILGWIGVGGIAVGHVIGLGAAMDAAGPPTAAMGKNVSAMAQAAKAAHAPTAQQIADALSLGRGSADAGVGVRAVAAATSAAAAAAKAAMPPTDAQNAALFVMNQNAKGASAAIDTLNSAWSAFLGLSTSLVTAQIGVEGGLKALAADAKAAGASFTGTNDASQKLQSDFESNLVPGLQNVLNGMRKAGAGTHDLATVLATDLKPAADRGALSNKALEQQIFDMAVQAGYTGPNKLRPLRDWIDHNAGSAQNAANKVNQFGAALARLPKSESLKVIMQGKGTYAIVNATTGVPYPVRAAAAGWYVSGGTPGKDSVPILAKPGELVVPTQMVSAGAVDHLRGKIPGFAAGGYVGNWNLTPQFLGGMYGDFGNAVKSGTSQALKAGLAAAVQAGKAQAQASASFASGPAAYGSAAAAQSFARSILPGGWSWPALLSLWNQESGWNPYAVNPSSGAYGIPQALGKGHPYSLGDYANQVRWGIGYIAGRYGNSQNAWAHEVAYNWYGNGLNAIFSKPTLIGVGERGREHVQVTPVTPAGSGGGAVNLTVNINAPVGSQAELQQWLVQSMNHLARTGHLTQAVKTANR